MKATTEQIAAWKQKHGSVFQFQTEDGKVAYLRSPDRNEIEAANTVSSKPLTSNAILAKACWLDGDKEILEDNKYFFGLCDHLKGIIKKVSGELSEL